MDAWRPLDRSLSQAWARMIDFTSFWSTLASDGSNYLRGCPSALESREFQSSLVFLLGCFSANRIRPSDTVIVSTCSSISSLGRLEPFAERGLDQTFDLRRRNSRDGAGLVRSAAQRGADVEAIANAVLAGKARSHAVALVIKELALEHSAAFRKLDLAFHGIGFEQFLHAVEGWAVQDRFMLSLEPFAAVMSFANVDPILEEVGEGTVGEWNATLIFRDLGFAAFGDDFPAIEFGDELAERSQLQVKTKDGPNGLGLGLVDDQLLVLGIVAEWHGAAGPFALAPAGGDLVSYALGRQLPFELGKGEKDVQGQPAHGRGGVELLGDGDERDRFGVKGLNQLCEIGERAGKAIDLVDHDHIDLAGLDIGQQLLEGRAVEVTAGVCGVVILLGQGPPSLERLALDIGLAGLPLGVQRVEFLLKAMLGGFAGVDGAAEDFGVICHRCLLSAADRSPKNRGPFHFVPVIAVGDFGEAGEGLAGMGKSVCHHRDPIGLAVPGPHQFGPGLDPPRQLQSASGLGRGGLHHLVEQPSDRRGKAAVGLLLNRVSNAAAEEVRTESLWRFGPE